MARKPYGIDWRDPARFAPTYDLRRAPEDYQVLLHQHAEDDLGSKSWDDVPKVHPVTFHPIDPLHDEVKGWGFDDRMNDDPEYINALAVAIKEGHPLPPAVIGHLGAATKGVVDGRHRILAAKKAGLTHVPVIDLDHTTWTAARVPGKMAKSADELRPLAKMALLYSHKTQPMMVWRVQNRQGIGPYHASGSLPKQKPWAEGPDPTEDFSDREWQSAGMNDSGDYGSGDAIFGFEKPEHAEAWFGGPRGLARLARSGFKLTQVPARKVWRGASGRQVMFMPHPSDPMESGRVLDAYEQGFSKAERIHAPNGHRSYMRVPKGTGGASCASCRYLSEDGKSCASKFFQAWNDGSALLPYPADESCSDWYEPREAALEKAIKDIEPGRQSSGSESWDYSHLLTPEQRQMDYRLRVRYNPERGTIYSTVHRGDMEAFGGVMGVELPAMKAIEPHAYLGLPGPMRNKGFGRAMYEALYAHAMKKHGVKMVSGGYHTAAARRVHESLAKKHGLKYEPEPGFPKDPHEDPADDRGLRGGPYEYMLKGEVRVDNPNAVMVGLLSTKGGNAHKTMGELVPSMMKAISELEPSKKSQERVTQSGAKYQLYDYSHLLPKEHRKHYKLVAYDYGYPVHMMLSHKGKYAGELEGHADEFSAGVQASGIDDEHQNKGLGRAMYEAFLAHAYHHKGSRSYRGGEHTAMAERAWQSMNRRHDLQHKTGKEKKNAWGDLLHPSYKGVLKADSDSMPACPKCGEKDVKVAIIGEPVYACQKCDHKWPVDFGPYDKSFEDTLRAGWVRAAHGGAKMKHPAFRHFKTKQVVESPLFHDIANLPDADVQNWEEGFVDHAGKFYNRQQAAKAVGAFTRKGGFGLESYAYLKGRDEGFYKAEKPFLKGPAFRHPNGKVVVTKGFHNTDELAERAGVPSGHPSLDDWQAGFVDHAGNFYDREMAAAAVLKQGQQHAPQNAVHGEQPGLESEQYAQGRAQGLYKSEPEFERPDWVEDPQLPARIQRIYDAVRANLTQDLLKPEYQGNTKNPFHGHCYVATEALWHILDGKKTGWERMHLATPSGPHWFLQHKKTDTILDPTAEQFAERPEYEKAKAKGFTVGPPDYNPDVPSKRAQTLIDRVKPALKKSEEELELAELAKSVGFIKFPKLGADSAQEPMTYPAGEGFRKRGKKGRAIFSARHQLANAPREEGAYALPSGQVVGGIIKPDPAMRARGANFYDVAKQKGHGAMGGGRVYSEGETPGAERSTTGWAMGGQKHGLVGVRSHEAQHTIFGRVAQNYGDEARHRAIEHIISKLPPEGVEAGKKVMGLSGYALGLDPEEFVTAHQQFLTDERSRKNIYKGLGLTETAAQQAFFKLMRRNFELMRHAARLVTPRMVQAPKLKSKKMRKSEGELRKSIAAIPPGRPLAHNPVTNESMHDFTHVLPQQLQVEGWKLRLHHTPRIQALTARVYDPQGQRQGSLTTYHRIEDGKPVLGVDTAMVQPEHRGKGLGLALYESSYAYGRRNLGLRKVVGGDHSAAAHGVHQALARKHGLHYEPEPYASDGEPSAPDAGPYEYMLKGEVSPGLENSDIGSELPDGTVVAKGMVKSTREPGAYVILGKVGE